MVATRRALEEQMVDYSRRLHTCGWVANHDGNLTVRVAEGRFLATPTSVSKANVSRENLIVVDGDGKVVSGAGQPFSELAIHLYIYRQRPDVSAIIHAHPATATGFAVSGVALRPTMMAEAVVSLGACVPLVPYAAPKTPEWTANIGPYLDDADAVLLEHHGVFTFAGELETAFLRMELIEHLARIQLAAHQAGLVRDIPKDHVDRLLAARTRAGLGRAAREAAAEEGDQANRRRHAAVEPGVRTLVREELGRALRK